MTSNESLDAWQTLWQSRPEKIDVTELRDRVASETRRRKLALIWPVLVTVVIGGWVIARAVARQGFDDVVLAVETWLFIDVIWAGALWIDRGTWRPLTDTTTAFVDVSIRRCRSDLNGLRFGALMYVAQLVFVLVWRYRYSSIELTALLTAWPVVVIGWVGMPVLAILGASYARRKNIELQYYEALRRQSIEE
jgi:hypothetical protein